MEKRIMKVTLDKNAVMPTRAHDADAGLDLYAPKGMEVTNFVPGGSVIIDTGVHVQIPEGYCGMLVSKSGLNVRFGITSTGLIDSGYTGSICVKLYNHGQGIYAVRGGDKISQLVLMPVITPTLEVVDRLQDTDRGDNGFGSTGK